MIGMGVFFLLQVALLVFGLVLASRFVTAVERIASAIESRAARDDRSA